jgi:putative ABC transport system substrate-binding protein
MSMTGQVGFAQPARKIHRIGVVTTLPAAEWAGPQPVIPYGKALLRGLGELGYAYGQHYVTEVRNVTGHPDGTPGVVAELANLGVEVIVGSGPTLLALKPATATIPVVMVAAIDPIADGLVQSLRRPGTNFTGLSHQSADGIGKRLELLKELVPSASPVAVLWDRGSRSPWEAAQAAAKSRGWKLLSLEIKDTGDIEAALKSAYAARAGALLVPSGNISFRNRQRIAELATRYRLPGMFDLRPFVEAGGLMSYGADLIDIWRQSARFVDKILKGAKPADLPVEQPTKFELIVNGKTAKFLGIKIPQPLLLRANEVIE